MELTEHEKSMHLLRVQEMREFFADVGGEGQDGMHHVRVVPQVGIDPLKSVG